MRTQPRGAAQRGQAMVEFAIVFGVFMMIVLGCIDFGRSIYVYSQLNNGVRDSAREGKISLSSGFGVNYSDLRRRVKVAKNPETSSETNRPGLASATVNVSCSGGCRSGDTLTVSATVPFQAVTQGFLGISPFNLSSSATVVLE